VLREKEDDVTNEVATDPMAKARAAKAAKAAQKETPTVEEVKALSSEEIEAKRAALLDQLADLPPVQHPGLRPGTRVGEGLKSEYVDYTRQWYENVEERKKDRDDQGRLIWPNYALKEVFPTKNEAITVNGVGYQLIAGRKCFLPDPHYSAWMDSIKQLGRNDLEFAKPDNPREANMMTPPHKMGDGPIRDRQA
jgi:hypothetical protein